MINNLKFGIGQMVEVAYLDNEDIERYKGLEIGDICYITKIHKTFLTLKLANKGYDYEINLLDFKVIPRKSYITYGTVLNIINFSGKDEVDTVMIVDNITYGDGNDCKLLDLSTKELIADYKNIRECLNKINVIKVRGLFDELFNI